MHQILFLIIIYYIYYLLLLSCIATPYQNAFSILMGPEKNLNQLLKSLNPHLQAKRFVFCSISQQTFDQLSIKPLCTFREEEGITIIIDVEEADQCALPYASRWALITCGVHSDLTAVGLLAALAGKLTTAGIDVNVLSAYYHDHLFVPAGEAESALALLRELSA